MKSALLIALFPAAGFAMMWEPFPTCTESHRVDSTRSVVWIDETLKPELAPYLGYARIEYHPGTCFPARTVFKPTYMETVIVLERTLSADRRRLDHRWIAPGSQEHVPEGTLWFSASGEVDSTIEYAFFQAEGQPIIRTSYRKVYRRSAQSLVITGSVRSGEGPWEEIDKDSVVVAGGVTTIHSVEDSESSLIRCAPEGPTYVCAAEAPAAGADGFGRRVWHLTSNRPDSLRTFRPDGRLESTDHWSWSLREPSSVRRPSWRPRLRIGPGFGRSDLLGRMLPEK